MIFNSLLFCAFLLAFFEHQKIGTFAKEMNFKFPSFAFGDASFFEYIKSRAHFDAFFGLPANETIKSLFKNHCQGTDYYSMAKFKEHLVSKFRTQLAVLHLMHKHWHCAKIGARIGKNGQELCPKFREHLDIVYEYILRQYVIGAVIRLKDSPEPSLVEQLAPIVIKPKYEANGHLQSVAEVIESLNNFSMLFFGEEQKIDAFAHFSELYFRELNCPNLLNEKQIKFTQSLCQLLKMDSENAELKSMSREVIKELKNDPFYDNNFDTELASKLNQFQANFKRRFESNKTNVGHGTQQQHIVEEKQMEKNQQIENLMREDFDKKLDEIDATVKEKLEMEKKDNNKKREDIAAFEDKFGIYLNSPFIRLD